MKNTDAFTPDLTDIMGSAWRADVEKLSQGRAHAGVASWLVSAPWAHPLWSGYAIECIHLRSVSGLGPPIIHLQGATHEMWIFAIDPDWVLNPGRRPALLQPVNFAAQFHAESDAAAAAGIEGAIREILQGTLSPDTDYRQQWAARFGSNMLRGGLAADSIAQTGDTVIVSGTGASNVRKLQGPDSTRN